MTPILNVTDMERTLADKLRTCSEALRATTKECDAQRKVLAQAMTAMLGAEKLFRANGFAMGGTSTAPFMAAITAIQGVLK